MKYKDLVKRRRLARARRMRKEHPIHWIWGVVILVFLISIIGYGSSSKTIEVSAKVETKTIPERVVTKTIEKVIVVDNGNKLDELVDKYAKQYAYGSLDRYSQLKATLHCLFYFESKHTAANGKGDHGLASGPLQYHAETYVNFRKLMIKQGLVTEIGDRDNLDNAIETTAWALAGGRGMNWGPILRGECILP